MTPDVMDRQKAEHGSAPDATSAGASSLTGGAGISLAALLVACGGGGGGTVGPTAIETGGGAVPGPAATGYLYTRADTNDQAARFLMQAQFAATDADVTAVRKLGFATWLQQQLALPLGEKGWDWLNSKGYGDVYNAAHYYDSSTPADHMVWCQLMSAPDAVRKRVALALSEFFVVSSNGLELTWRSHAAAHYWDTLNTYAFGNYRDLLEAITLNPAMGVYLNTRGNKKADGKGSQPDENYAREVMQLFSIGLVMLNPDGTPQLTDGHTTDTYTASDISNLAQVFTGYDIDRSQNVVTTLPQVGGGTRDINSTAFTHLPLVQVGNNHSPLAATFLGVTVPANASAAVALKTVLDTLFNHPNTAPFFCKQMIQRLVTSNPSPAYVARVAAVFVDNGQAVRGDLATVWAAILLDDEARAPLGLTLPEFGKLREPMVRLVQWVRAFGVTSTRGDWAVADLSDAATRLGQSPLRSPSVFNFFRPGYVPPAAALSAGAVVPEFQLVNESSVGGYLNFMMGVISNGLNSGDIKASYVSELALVADAPALVQRLNTLLCAGQLSAATQTIIVTALNATAITASSSDAAKRNRVCAAVLMVMACAEYLIQK